MSRDILEKAGIDRRYQNITFAEIEKRGVPTHLKTSFSKVKKYSEKLDHYVYYGQGFILKGTTGTLKTTFSVAILRRWLEMGNRGLFVTMAGLLDRLNVLKARNKVEWASYEQKLREIDLLVLDDLGAEDCTPWDVSKIDAIVCERYNKAKPILITTNLSNEEIKMKYNERIYDRLKNTSILTLVMNGESLRKVPKGFSNEKQ